MVQGLTDRQLDVLCYIREFINHWGYPPTLREIAVDYGCTYKNVHDYLLILLDKGYLQRISPYQSARNIKLTNKLGFDGKKYYTKLEVPL